jgi:hypothetical protein
VKVYYAIGYENILDLDQNPAELDLPSVAGRKYWMTIQRLGGDLNLGEHRPYPKAYK